MDNTNYKGLNFKSIMAVRSTVVEKIESEEPLQYNTDYAFIPYRLGFSEFSRFTIEKRPK